MQFSPQPYDAVTLDAAGTLINVARPVGETYATLARPYGGVLEPKLLSRGFGKYFPRMPPMAFPGASANEAAQQERAWWKNARRKRRSGCGWRTEVLTLTSMRSNAYFAQAEAWMVYPEVPPLLATLAARGVKLAIVSNFDSRLASLVPALGLNTHLDALIFSTEAGAAKPDAGIFELALRELGVDASQTLHVGDNVDADYHGARQAGLHAVVVDRKLRTAASDAAMVYPNVGATDGARVSTYLALRTYPR